MTVIVSRPYATNAVLQITLGRVLKAVVAFKGLMIEWVVVKGYMESMDLWTESRHKVFKKVTENSHAAMLHFYSPTLPELAVRSFMVITFFYINFWSNKNKIFCFYNFIQLDFFRHGFTVLILYSVILAKNVVIIFTMPCHPLGGTSEHLNHFMKSVNLNLIIFYITFVGQYLPLLTDLINIIIKNSKF